MREGRKMKSTLRTIFICLGFFLSLFLITPVFAEGATIKQVDPSRLLSMQTVRLFIDVENSATTAPLDLNGISVSESADGVNFTPVTVRSIKANANKNEGISWFLLLDNSGSMWDSLDGKPTTHLESTRMAHAKKAVRDFISNISPKDYLALAVFNTNYSTLLPMSQDASGIEGALDRIQKPDRDDAYTELYGSLEKSILDFGKTETANEIETEAGRRNVLIVLSDGEHFPPASSKSTVTVDDGIEAAHRKNISCHVVNFAPESDSQIPRIAAESGGLVFDARNSSELLNIYNNIRRSVLQEYSLTYTAAMLRGDKRYVKISTPSSGESLRYYYAGTVLGSSTQKPNFWYILFFIIPLGLYLAILLFRLERETTEAGIQVLYGSAGMKTKVFTLAGAQTIIGGDNSADITLAGNPSLAASAATIVFDKTKGQYTISASSDLTVNNRPVKTKALEPGDVINMSGTVVVFDDKAQAKPKSKPRPKK